MKEMDRDKIAKSVLKRRRMINFLLRMSGYGSGGDCREIYIDTEVGPVRTLWYGYEAPGTRPVFFDMHGGGFILMSAEADGWMNSLIYKETGCKVVSIDYSLAPEHPFPAAVNEVYAVVKQVHDNAGKYGIDPERMAIGGHSAGGNLATVTCIQAARKKEFRFACQVLDYPPLDLATSPYDKPCPRGAIKPCEAAIYDACYIDPSQARNPLVSPVYASGEELAGQPPALIILAGRDSLRDEGAKYTRLLSEAGVDVELHEFPTERHGFTYFRTKEAPRAMSLITDFLKKHLG